MTLSAFLVKCFWAGFAHWVSRDPVAAEARLASFFADAIERVVAAQEQPAA